MPAIRLTERRVGKPWGKRVLPAPFRSPAPGEEPIGEIWFEHPAGEDAALMVKFLFTSERLSIQVHPDDAGARAAGHARGKEEAWLILDADDDAELGIGLLRDVTPDALRAAALDGGIVDLVDWRRARAGDFYYSPAGTVHALGPGLTLVEIQQNVDLTYRLYDYGRPRELHLNAGIAASRPAPFAPPPVTASGGRGREILADGRAFVLERWSGAGRRMIDARPDAAVWLVPVAGAVRIDGAEAPVGSAWWSDAPAGVDLDAGAELLVAYAGGIARADPQAA